MYTYYGTAGEAATYFGNRLHEEAWTSALAADRTKALIQATRIIDSLNFKGYKAATYAVLFDADGEPICDVTDDEIRTAELSQELEFPRGTDIVVPDAIKLACWEVAYMLLDDVDPDIELENLGMVGQGIASVRVTYDRSQVQVEHLLNGVPSATAWRLLLPFLRDDNAVKLSRVD